MKKFLLPAIAVLAIGSSASAQPAPSGGSQIQQIPRAPTLPSSIPEVRVERGPAPALPATPGARIVVQSIRITGSTRFTQAELVAAAQFSPGAELDLAGLRAMAMRISDFYARHGFFVAQAYLAAQNIEDGAVTITVIEGQYGKVQLDNQTKVSDGLARSVLAGLDSGDVVASPPLERRLLLLSDLPGVVVGSTLTPGSEVGTSDLLVRVTPGRPVNGSVEADNAGNRYTGAYRAGGTLNFNEPTGHGDVASLRVLSSGEGLNYLRGAYQAQVGKATAGVSYAQLWYKLRREFAPLDAHGTVRIASVFASYPLIRSYDANLRVLGDLSAKKFVDKVGLTSSQIDKSARVATLGFAGDRHDRLWGGGWTSYAVYGSAGDLDIKTPSLRAIDAVTARTNGSYQKLTLEADRLQTLAGPLSLYVAARGQLASKNLDVSEKMELGGAYGVRAYPEGEAYGDEGYLVSAEARMRLAGLGEPLGGQVQAIAFLDHGEISINKRRWAAGDNHRSLTAAGAGLTWADRYGLAAQVSYAFKLGDEPALSAPDHSGRLWVHVSKTF